MTATFDAGRHLRLLAERELSGAVVVAGVSDRLVRTAATLAAAGLLDEATAHAILRDHDLALAARGRAGTHWPHEREERPTPPAPFAAVRAARAEATWTLPVGRITTEYALLGEDATRITAAIRHGSDDEELILPIRVADDRGRTVEAEFVRGGTGEGYGGEIAGPALHPDTAWIEIEGTRVELHDERVSVAVHREPVVASPATYLWDLVADTFPVPYARASIDDVHQAIETLLDARALDAGDPTLALVDAVLHAEPGHPPLGASPRWSDAIRLRGQAFVAGGGRTGRALLAAPLRVDGDELQLLELRLHDHAVTVAFAEAAPSRARRRGERPMRWWCDDGADHHAMGIVGWSLRRDAYDVRWATFPWPFPATASSLNLTIDGSTERVTVTIDLAEVPLGDGDEGGDA